MPDYNLTGLSPRSFEHLIQALAIKIIGVHVKVFGDGPDGQREAIFEGQTHYPAKKNAWNGYGVIQAKYHQRPAGTKKDGEWALQALKKELDGFTGKKRGLRVPQYYIFATNVVLGPAHKTGAKDKAIALIKSYKTKLSFKDYALWDYDQICRFLDTYEDIRRSYAAFITPGDILAKIQKLLGGLQPDFSRVMKSFLQKELLKDQYSRLEQAEHSYEKRVSLANVFIDLPVIEKPVASPDEEKATDLPGFARHVLSLARERFIHGVESQTADTREGDGEYTGFPGRCGYSRWGCDDYCNHPAPGI